MAIDLSSEPERGDGAPPRACSASVRGRMRGRRVSSPAYSASGCGRIWKRTISLVFPRPPSLCQFAIVS